MLVLVVIQLDQGFMLRTLMILDGQRDSHPLRLDVVVDQFVPLDRQLIHELLGRVLQVKELLFLAFIVCTLSN
jgi:hypothetical protein